MKKLGRITKGIILAILVTLIAGSLTGCGDKKASASKTATSEATETKEIVVGTSPGPYSELFINGVKPILEKEGYNIEIVEFTDLKQADVALSEKQIQLNVDQHTAYLENFNTNTGADLTPITPIPTVPAGLFGGRKKDLKEVAEGDKVAIPQDVSNAARGYALLQKAGWIKLKEGVELSQATVADIVENKYGIEIVEMDSSTIPRSLSDLDYAVIPGSIVYSASLDAKEALLQEDVLKKFELVATVTKENKDTDWAKAVVSAYHSDEFKKYLATQNKDNYWFVPEELQ